jgi:hypothetical protein
LSRTRPSRRAMQQQDAQDDLGPAVRRTFNGSGTSFDRENLRVEAEISADIIARLADISRRRDQLQLEGRLATARCSECAHTATLAAWYRIITRTVDASKHKKAEDGIIMCLKEAGQLKATIPQNLSDRPGRWGQPRSERGGVGGIQCLCKARAEAADACDEVKVADVGAGGSMKPAEHCTCADLRRESLRQLQHLESCRGFLVRTRTLNSSRPVKPFEPQGRGCPSVRGDTNVFCEYGHLKRAIVTDLLTPLQTVEVYEMMRNFSRAADPEVFDRSHLCAACGRAQSRRSALAGKEGEGCSIPFRPGVMNADLEKACRVSLCHDEVCENCPDGVVSDECKFRAMSPGFLSGGRWGLVSPLLNPVTPFYIHTKGSKVGAMAHYASIVIARTPI